MIVFIDFEASSLGKGGFPVEVGWVFETGEGEAHLIRPAPGWTEWSAEAEAIHGIPRAELERHGAPPERVAGRMLEVLAGHGLYASAPSWDGHWLSLLLRAGGRKRHALRLADTDEAHRIAARSAADPDGIIAEARRAFEAQAPRHRALDDARRELGMFQDIRNRVNAATERRRDGARPQPG